MKIETTELSKDKIERLLIDKKVNQQTALNFVAVIENCERARYAPGSSVSIKGDYEKASSIIASIDRQLWEKKWFLICFQGDFEACL